MDLSTHLGVKCSFIASDTVQNSMHVTASSWSTTSRRLSGHLVPTTDVSVHMSQRKRHLSSVAGHSVPRASITAFWTHPGSLSFNTVYSEFLTVWFLRFVSNQTLAVCELNVTGNRPSLCITHDDFNPPFFVGQSRVAGSSVTPPRPLTLSGNLLFSCIRASPSEPHASCLNRLGSRTLALSRWSALVGPALPAPTKPEYEGVALPTPRSHTWLDHLGHTSSHGHCTNSSKHSWLTCLSASPELARRCPSSITFEDEVDRRLFAHPTKSLSEKTSTTCCSACRP